MPSCLLWFAGLVTCLMQEQHWWLLEGKLQACPTTCLLLLLLLHLPSGFPLLPCHSCQSP